MLAAHNLQLTGLNQAAAGLSTVKESGSSSGIWQDRQCTENLSNILLDSNVPDLEFTEVY